MKKDNNIREKQLTFDVGTNFDPELIRVINKNNKCNEFKSVFGKLKTDLLGGGRASAFLPDVSIKELEKYIELCHLNKLTFNYLINPMCMENKELEIASHFKIVDFIKQLESIGVDAITVNSPYLCELIKKQFPKMKVTIGLYSYVFDLNLIKRWIDLGADEITLAHHNNRDFKTLKRMLEFTKDKNVTLRLIANNLCLHMCPYSIMHGTVQGHISCSESNVYGDIDYCIFKCLHEKIKNSYNLISSDWIRPEDLKYYEKLCEEVDNFDLSIKLVERTKSTKFLSRVVTAYANRSYEGNLLDILLWPKAEEMISGPNYKDESTLRRLHKFNEKNLMRYASIFNLPNIYIDNKKLDGFFEKFIDNFDCNNKICGCMKDKNKSNMYCYYCDKWAGKVVSNDFEETEEWLDICDKVCETLNDSQMFIP